MNRSNSLARLIAGLVAALAVSLGIAGGASASVCSAGDFCLWQGPHETGGLYQWHGNDSDLRNDFFENADTTTRVAWNASSLRNRGYACGGCDQVRTYSAANYVGTAGCIPRGYALTTGSAAADYGIESFRWGSCF